MKPALFIKVPFESTTNHDSFSIEEMIYKKLKREYNIIVVPNTFEFEVLDKDGLRNIVKAVEISSEELKEILDNEQ